jgi:enoyl-CoA hydratase/carnithine racemase
MFSDPPHNHARVALLRGLTDILDALADEPNCRAAALASDGNAFCAGADLAAREGAGVGGSTHAR